MSLRFVLNTKYPDRPASAVCIGSLGSLLTKHGYEVTYNDWENYERYDVAIFMYYDPQIEKARRVNPNILVGLGDPKPPVIQDAPKADFLLVSSVEQRDVLLKYNPNVFIYYMFTDIKPVKKVHSDSGKIVIGYHGNKTHLNAMYPNVTLAIEKLSHYFEVEFHAIYNIKALGKWKIGVPDPKKVKTCHIQWSADTVSKALESVDIGIVPNTLLSHTRDHEKKKRFGVSKIFTLENTDYLLQFKVSSNPGRIYVFAQNGIPVVADFFPSAAQFIAHGERGFLAHSTEGWFDAFYQLATSAELRQKMSDNLFEYCNTKASREKTFSDFINMVTHLKTPSRLPSTFKNARRDATYCLSLFQEHLYNFSRPFTLIPRLYQKVLDSI